MNLGFSDVQEMLRDSARDVCGDAQGKVRHGDGSAARFWTQMGDLGWMGASLPEELGGSGGGLMDAGVISAELGQAGLFGGFAETVGSAFALARQGGESSDAVRDLLTGVAEGKIQISLLQTFDADAPISVLPSSDTDGNGLLIAPQSEKIVVLQLVDGDVPRLVAVELASCDTEQIATTSRAGDLLVRLTGTDLAALPQSAVLAKGADAEKIWNLSVMATRCLAGAQLCGASRHLVQVAIDYSRVREQFGQLIGSFQAVQHAIVDEFSAVEGAELAIFKALAELDKETINEQFVLAAIANVREAAFTVLMKSYDVLGGVGFMEEHSISTYARGIVPILTSFGTAERCESDVGALVRKGSWLS